MKGQSLLAILIAILFGINQEEKAIIQQLLNSSQTKESIASITGISIKSKVEKNTTHCLCIGTKPNRITSITASPQMISSINCVTYK